MKLPEKDIHCHLLPGVDDGFQNAQDSLSALSRMAASGCREIVFTPHMNPDVYPDITESRHREEYQSFSEQIPAELGLSTTLAAEYMIVNGFEDRVSSRADQLLTYPDGSILVEMSYYYRSKNLEQALFELNMAGLNPILAHPERYLYMADSLSDFDQLVDAGCRLQMNIMSLTGTYGRQSMRILDYLLKRNLYSFIATDLHSPAQLNRILAYRPGLLQRFKLSKTDLL